MCSFAVSIISLSVLSEQISETQSVRLKNSYPLALLKDLPY